MKQTMKNTGIAWLIDRLNSKGIALDSPKGQYIFQEYKRVNNELMKEGIRNVRI